MQLEWRRINETTWIDTDKIAKDGGPAHYWWRPILYPLPVFREDISKCLGYETNSEIAVSLVVARRSTAPDAPSGMYDYPELLIKRLPWTIKNLHQKTDIVQERVRIIVTLDTALRELAEPYLEACKFPSSHLNWIDSEESIVQGCFCKIEAASSQIFQKIDRVLNIDLSLNVGAHPDQWVNPMFNRIKSVWTTQKLCSYATRLFCELTNHQNCLHPLKFYKEKQDRIIKSFAQFMGYSESEERQYWQTCYNHYNFKLGIMGMHRTLLDNNFLNDMKRLMQKSTELESMPVYARYHNWTEDDVCSAGNILQLYEDERVNLNADPNQEAQISFVNRFFPLEVWQQLYGF